MNQPKTNHNPNEDPTDTTETQATPSKPALTLADLPPPNTKRWVSRRKAAVVSGVRLGIISLEEACRRYALTEDEFNCWADNLKSFGLAGLKTTRIQHFRNRLQPAE